MSTPLLLLMAVIHVGIVAGYCRDGNYGLAFVFLCYALSNAGFIYANLSRTA